MVALGRRVEFDPRSLAYPIRTLLPRRAAVSKFWDCDVVLDQGNVGACVGFSWAHELAADPEMFVVDNGMALDIYFRAQQLDQWPGEDYEGTSVIAGAKTVQERGFLTEYRWGFGLNDVLEAIAFYGPVVLGINWYDSMFNIDSNGFLNIAGGIAGGHAILARGVNVESEYVLLHNSWGPSWGTNGTAKLRFEDLGQLLYEEGECCVPVVRTPAEPPPVPEPEAGCLPGSSLIQKVRSWSSKSR